MTDKTDRKDEDIVPLGELRPSRRHFGPVPAPASSASGRPPTERKRRPQAGASRSEGVAAPEGSQKSTVRRAPALPAPDQVDRAPARKRAGARGGPPRSQSQKQRRPETAGRRDEFADGLARSQRRSPAPAKPSSGWRGVLLKATGGVVNVGLSAAERREQQLRRAVRRPVTDGTIAVFSRKGGVGKTTISAYLGATLAVERGGRIVALDGDAEAGSLGWLLAPRAPSTLAALASADPIPNDYATLRRYTASTPDGLDVIVGDPAEATPISATGLEAVADQLGRHYDLSVFDTGAGVTRATGRVLVNSARVLLLVMGPSVDSVRAAERTLAWLDERPGEAADADVPVIAVINGIPETAKRSHIEKIESHFADRCDAVVRIPWDAYLAAGSTSVSLDRLAKPTRRALLELAATTVGTLARPARRPAAVGGRRVS